MWLKSYGDQAPIDGERLRALRHALQSRHDDVADFRRRLQTGEHADTHLIAAMAGRRLAYAEAVELVDRVIAGMTLPRPPRVKRRDKARLADLRSRRALEGATK